MKNFKTSRWATIRFPQSVIGKSIFNVLFGIQCLGYLFRALSDKGGSLQLGVPTWSGILGLLLEIASFALVVIPAMWFVRWLLLLVGVIKIRPDFDNGAKDLTVDGIQGPTKIKVETGKNEVALDNLIKLYEKRNK